MHGIYLALPESTTLGIHDSVAWQGCKLDDLAFGQQGTGLQYFREAWHIHGVGVVICRRPPRPPVGLGHNPLAAQRRDRLLHRPGVVVGKHHAGVHDVVGVFKQTAVDGARRARDVAAEGRARVLHLNPCGGQGFKFKRATLCRNYACGVVDLEPDRAQARPTSSQAEVELGRARAKLHKRNVPAETGLAPRPCALASSAPP